MKTSDIVRKLIRACVDDERTLLHERRFVDAGRAEVLTGLAHERRQFVSELEHLGHLVHLGQSHDGSWAELLYEAWRRLRVVATGRNNGDAIGACRHSRARAEARYDEAIQRDCPDELRVVLATHRLRLRDEAEELDKLQF